MPVCIDTHSNFMHRIHGLTIIGGVVHELRLRFVHSFVAPSTNDLAADISSYLN